MSEEPNNWRRDLLELVLEIGGEVVSFLVEVGWNALLSVFDGLG